MCRVDAHRPVGVQVGHLTKKNKKCSMYVEPELEPLEPWIPDMHLDDIIQVRNP